MSELSLANEAPSPGPRPSPPGRDDLRNDDGWRFVAESIPHIVWIKAPDGTTEYINQRGVEFLGLDAGDTYTWGWLAFVHPQDVAATRAAWEQALRERLGYEFECRIRCFDRSYREVVVRGLPMRGPDGSILRWIGTLTDVDSERSAQRELHHWEGRAEELSTLLETTQAMAPMGFATLDRSFRYVRINEVLAAVDGLTVAAHLGRAVAEVAPDLWLQSRDAYGLVLATGEPLLNIETIGETAADPGQNHDWLTSYYPIRINGEITGVGVVVLDVTERARAEEFRAVVLDNIREGLYIVDGDGLLTYMNPAASKMLGWTEDELRGKSMQASVHYQRCDGTPIEATGHSAGACGEALTRKDGTVFPVEYSVAPIRSASSAAGAVVVFSDITDETNDHASVRRELAALSWIGRIRDALDESRLVIYAQPIVPIAGGRESVELLLRMVSHGGELVLPGSFLPTAEKYGLIGEIDQWVAVEAVRLAATGARISMNLSAHSVNDPDFLVLIERELRDSGADAANIVFEITETALIADLDAAEMFVRRLGGLGCGVALDDFGTGFGSFLYLKRLPLDYLKIDIEFVRDLARVPGNRHVIKAIVNLARAFGLETIAEGVENEETLRVLVDEGVDFVQGFHLGHPAPIEDARCGGSAARGRAEP